MNEYEWHDRKLYDMLEESRRLLQTYTPNNVDQEYKHNYNKAMEEIINLYGYYKQNAGIKLALALIARHIKDKLHTLDSNELGYYNTYYNLDDTFNCMGILKEYEHLTTY